MADAVDAVPPPPELLGGGGGGGGSESGRSSPSPAASPEFEFWMVGKNPSSFPSAALLTADELFSGGVVLPLHTLQASPPEADGEGDGHEGADVKEPDAAALAPPETGEGDAAQPPLAESCPAPTPDLPAVTFKWKDIFKAAGGGEPKERKKLERRISSVSGNAELININIWPFSRSRSAGHSAGAGTLSRAKPNPSPNASVSVSANAAGTASAPAAPAPPPAARKVSSAPCSRSNSRGESAGPVPAVSVAAAAAAAAAAADSAAGPVPATSMLRRLVPGQGRNTGLGAAAGIRLGRASPVWQLRRNKLQQAAAEQKQASAKKKAVPGPAPAPAADADADAAAAATATASSSSSDDKAAPSVTAPATAACRNNAGAPEGGGEEGNPPQGLFGLRTFFSKKVY
ncbi:hypothetical protein ACP4OV_029765 [Aristida adscensionis]